MNDQPHTPPPPPPRRTKTKKVKPTEAPRQLVIEMGTFVLCFD